MATGPLPAFRRDLQISAAPSRPGEKPAHIIRDPRAGHVYQFGAEEVFLCGCLDGRATVADVRTRFEQQFHRPISVQSLRALIEQLEELNLLEGKAVWSDTASGDSPGTAPSTDTSVPDYDAVAAEPTPDPDAFEDEGRTPKPGRYEWTLANPHKLITAVLPSARRLRWLSLLWCWLLIPGVPLCTYILYTNNALFYEDLATRSLPLTYLGRLVYILVFVDLLRCAFSALVIAHYGGKISEFGIRLRFGLIPRFWIDRDAVRGFARHPRLWSYGTTPLVHISIYVFGVWLWAITRHQGSVLCAWGILLTQSGLLGFIMSSSPFRTSYGYKWLVTWLKLPPNTLQTAMRVLIMTVTRKPLPMSISSARRWRLLTYSVALVVCWAFFSVKIATSIVTGLSDAFPEVFGRATEFILYLLVVIMILRWALPRWSKLAGNTQPPHAIDDGYDTLAQPAKKMTWPQRIGWSAFAVCLSLMPFPLRPGGAVEMLPPQQQSLTAPISGKVIEVHQDGGDGKRLLAGSPVALMGSTTLDNEVATWRDKVKQQEALVEQARATDAQLIIGARPEELDQANARAAAAEQAVSLAQTQLESSRITAGYSQREVDRLQILEHAGALPLQQLEDARENAAISALDVTAKSQSLDARKSALLEEKASLALLTKGATTEQLEASRQQLAAVEAELRVDRQQLAYSEARCRDAALVMPMDGYLVDAYLSKKIGSYLAQGDVFTIVQSDNNMAVRMDLPEYEAVLVRTGCVSEVRLLAFSGETFQGTVSSIEPVPATVLYGRVFRVQVTLDKSRPEMKPGLTGYCKVQVGYRPLIWVVIRPVVRFIQVELWSWLP